MEVLVLSRVTKILLVFFTIEVLELPGNFEPPISMPRPKWVFQALREWLCFLLKAQCLSDFQKLCFYDKIQVVNLKTELMGTYSLSSTKAWTLPCSQLCPQHLRQSGNKDAAGKKVGSRETERGVGERERKRGEVSDDSFSGLVIIVLLLC